MNRKNLSISLIAVLAAIFLTACGSSSHHAPPQVMLAMDTPPPSAVEINLSFPLSASVVNDSSGGGIVWTLGCDQADCGTLSSSTTASGDTIVYTAPATVPESDAAFGGMALTVTATSATDSTVFAAASSEVLVISDTQLLIGNYAFYVEGTDANGFTYTAAGSVVLDGLGNVTGGEEDFFSTFNATPSVGDVITGGTYLVNQNGTGNLVVDVATPGSPPVTDPTVGVGGTQTFSVVAVNNNHLRIEEFDASATSIGSMDFQTIGDITSVAGGYAYIVSGVDGVGAPLGIGGVFSTDGAGGFSNDQADINDGETVTTNVSGQAGSFTAPDVNGRGVSTIGSSTFAYYQINAEALVFVETDGTQATVGEALGQGGSTGAFTPASLGPAAFGAIGNTFGVGASIAGQFTADGTSAFAGFADSNENAAFIGTGSITGTYALDSNGYGNFVITGGDLLGISTDITQFGVYAIDPTLNVNDPNNPNGGAGGAFLLNLDTDAILTGVLATQSDATDVFNSNNALSFGGVDVSGPVDFVGQFLSDGVSSITGTGDQNELFGAGQTAGVPLTGSFAADPSNPGRSTATLTINGGANPNNVVLYQASPGLSFYIDVDATPGPLLEIASGYVEGQ